MKKDLRYIERKSGSNHQGPAWIGWCTFSKSKRTVYFDGQAFGRIGGQSIRGNHWSLDTGEEYWISGVKRDGSDRHRFGSGPIEIERAAVDAYLELRRLDKLPKQYVPTDQMRETDIARTHAIVNESYRSPTKGMRDSFGD